jgi:hypothetical protein
MGQRKYPLEPLSTLRGKKVDEAAAALATATCNRETANHKRLASEKKCDAHDAAATHVRSAEGEALARGELRVADLALAGAWELRVSEERRELSSALDLARVEEIGARAGEELACRKLASRKTDAQLVEKDRARWREKARKEEEMKEEEASSEVWRPSKS